MDIKLFTEFFFFFFYRQMDIKLFTEFLLKKKNLSKNMAFMGDSFSSNGIK